MRRVTASSTSTYMDLTKAATQAADPQQQPQQQQPAPPADADPEFIGDSARVLAAIHAGAHGVPELKEQTGLETDRIVSLLAGLLNAGLVEVRDDANGAVHATLTENARAALTNA
jgi:hypothetical protein